MLIGAYGMFWSRHLVNWQPGSGSVPWQLLGSLGVNAPGFQVADFRRARGVYVLFDDFGAYYTGLAMGSGGLGSRLKQHLTDGHAGRWDRFCWFSFDAVASRRSADGTTAIRRREKPVPSRDTEVIRELEALLITIMNTRNTNQMRFLSAKQWRQVSHEDSEAALDKVYAIRNG